MAGTITVSTTVSLNNSPHIDSFSPGDYSITQYTKGVFCRTYALTGSETDIDLSSLTNPGIVILQNVGSKDTIVYGPKSGTQVPLGELRVGEHVVYNHAPSVTLTVKAQVSSATLLVTAYET